MTFSNKVDLIAAIGRSGQIGLDGKLPWRDADDLREFAERTTDCLLIAGWRTYESVGRTLHGIRGRHVLLDTQNLTPQVAWREAERHLLKNVYVIGGAKTYQRWIEAGWVRHSIITHVDYDGPADVYMPRLYGNEMIHRLNQLADRARDDRIRERLWQGEP